MEQDEPVLSSWISFLLPHLHYLCAGNTPERLKIWCHYALIRQNFVFLIFALFLISKPSNFLCCLETRKRHKWNPYHEGCHPEPLPGLTREINGTQRSNPTPKHWILGSWEIARLSLKWMFNGQGLVTDEPVAVAFVQPPSLALPVAFVQSRQ